jgi:hypothetical protein
MLSLQYGEYRGNSQSLLLNLPLPRLFFYYPLLGMINMFASILKTPAGPATEKDMGVIDMAAGYFAYLDYSTDAVFSFDLVKNLAQWARQVVAQARGQVPTPLATQFLTERDVLPPMDNFSVNLSPDVGLSYTVLRFPTNHL